MKMRSFLLSQTSSPSVRSSHESWNLKRTVCENINLLFLLLKAFQISQIGFCGFPSIRAKPGCWIPRE